MKIEVSTWSIVKTILILIIFWFLFQIRSIIELLFIVMILVAALGPAVAWLRARHVPRPVAVTLVMVAVFVFLSLLLAFIIPNLANEIKVFTANQFPALVDRLGPFIELISKSEKLLANLTESLQKIGGNILTGIISLFGGLVSALTVFALTFYFLIEEDPLRQAGINLWPVKYRDQISKSLERIMDKLGAWVRGQFLLSVFVGSLTTLGLSLIGVPAPLALGVLAGLLEVIPIVGPLIAGTAMVIMALMSPEAVLLKVSLTVGFYILLQLVEAQILVPNVMRSAIGLSPFLVIVALLIGNQLDGIAGAILAIPLTAILQVIAQDWPKFRPEIN